MMRTLKLFARRAATGAGLLLASAATTASAWAQDAATAVATTTTTVTTAAVAAPARLAATPGLGQPDGGWDLQAPMSPIAHEAQRMVHGVLDPMMVVISVVVLLLLLFVVVRFRAAANPVASRTSHNTMIEVVWTLIPVLILVWIAVPSFRLLANQYDPPKADLTIKATGHQWYWEYEYPDQGGFSFDAIMLESADAKKLGSPDLLDTDNRVVVPVGATVKVLTTAADVLHSWALPAFWVKMDAVPGRINETWFKAEREGVFFGQCSELCGTRHGFMPIAIEVVSKATFDAWVAAKQKENGITPPVAGAAAAASPATVAAAPEAAAPAAAATTESTPAAPAAAIQ